jgi:hypothetical protein
MRQQGLIALDQVERNIAVVIKGERTSTKYDKLGKVVESVVTVTPADAARGAMILDQLSGGELGLTPEVMHTSAPTTDDMYEQYAPKQVNGSIIQNEHARGTLVIDVKTED